MVAECGDENPRRARRVEHCRAVFDLNRLVVYRQLGHRFTFINEAR
jgi:hypothetical protein